MMVTGQYRLGQSHPILATQSPLGVADLIVPYPEIPDCTGFVWKWSEGKEQYGYFIGGKKYLRFLDHGFYIIIFLVCPFSFSSLWQYRALWQWETDLNWNLATPPDPGFLSASALPFWEGGFSIEPVSLRAGLELRRQLGSRNSHENLP